MVRERKTITSDFFVSMVMLINRLVLELKKLNSTLPTSEAQEQLSQLQEQVSICSNLLQNLSLLS
jgi:hypothetical protein